MKKVFFTSIVILAVAVVAFLAGTYVTDVFAQRGGTGSRDGNGGMMGGGYGHMGGRGMHGQGAGMMGDGTYGPMHDYMIPALAEGLGMTTEDLQARIDGGETPYEVAVSLGFTADKIQTIFSTAHAEALQAAVDAGVITQEQADWMNSHMQPRWENGFGPGSENCPMHGDGNSN